MSDHEEFTEHDQEVWARGFYAGHFATNHAMGGSDD